MTALEMAATVLGTIVGISVLLGVARFVYTLTSAGRNAERMHKLGYIAIALVFVLVSQSACNGGGGGDDTTVESVTGVEDADEIIEDVKDAVDDTRSTLCSACLLGEKLGGDPCNCNNICDTDIVCQEGE